jgi:hypothetical protein
MPWIMQMLGCAGLIIGIALAVWIGFWLLVVLLVLSAFVALWRYLLRKGIVNPTPGVSVQTHQDANNKTIDGEYRRVASDDDAAKDDR